MEIRTKPSSKEYRDNWDQIWAREKEETFKCRICEQEFTPKKNRWDQGLCPECFEMASDYE